MTQSPPPPPTDILSSIDQRALPQVKIAWPHESFKRVSLNLSAAAFPKTPPSTSHSLDSTEDANEFLETLQNRPSSIHSIAEEKWLELVASPFSGCRIAGMSKPISFGPLFPARVVKMYNAWAPSDHLLLPFSLTASFGSFYPPS